jgi:tetratricopeptide (TPR) repeat protein
MDSAKSLQPPRTASLDNPLYYLDNMEMVVRWVRDHHRDLLTAEEVLQVADFLELPTASRALLTRMIMRTGEFFRPDRLHYPELPQDEREALGPLQEQQWLVTDPDLDPDTLFRLFTLAELRPPLTPLLEQAGLAGKPAKAVMLDCLHRTCPDPRPVREWLGGSAPAVVRLTCMALFDRLRLMFFGNLRQSWSDFVLVELGLQAYEPVPFGPESRAFQSREEVDTYLLMHHCRERLDEGEAPAVIWHEIPPAPDNPWLAARRDRLLLELGRLAERQGDRNLALEAWTASHHRDARLRQLRLLERMKRYEQAWQILQPALGELRSDREQVGLARLQKRLARKLSLSIPEPSETVIPESRLVLANPDQLAVEHVVAAHLGQDREPVFYVENTLFNALFGLLFWEVIFHPVPGAFFHPFHTGPVDLTREDFYQRRRALFDQYFAALSSGDYREIIRDNWRNKQGISNPFVIWPVISESLLEMAMDCLPPEHLEAVFRRLLLDVKEHRSGFPDLIGFSPEAKDPACRYRLIEVKGPGDRLQDHQQRWLSFFLELGAEAQVCHVTWDLGPVDS